MQKRLLMLHATTSEIPFILAARHLGYYVITTSTMPHYPGHKYADEYIYGNYNDYDEMIRLCQEHGIDAISQGCSDDCALTAAYVGEKLGMKGHDSYENARIIHRKDDFKRFAAENNILTPISHSFTDIESAMKFEEQLHYPVIVKPNDLGGGQGIHIAESRKEYSECVKNAFERSHEKHIVVEPFIRGTLHSLNTFIIDQKVVSYCTANDYSFKNQYLTNAGLAPADGGAEAAKVLIPETERVAGLLGLVDGQLHMQYIVDRNGQPWIIEMMRRNIGNNWMTMITDTIGVNWPEWCIRAEAGLDCRGIAPPREPDGYYGYYSAMAPQNGIVRKIHIKPEFQPFVYQYMEWVDPGHEIKNYMGEKIASLSFFFKTEEEKKYFIPRLNEMVWVELEKNDQARL